SRRSPPSPARVRRRTGVTERQRHAPGRGGGAAGHRSTTGGAGSTTYAASEAAALTVATRDRQRVRARASPLSTSTSLIRFEERACVRHDHPGFDDAFIEPRWPIVLARVDEGLCGVGDELHVGRSEPEAREPVKLLKHLHEPLESLCKR